MDAQLSQVDWNAAVKNQSKPLTAAARELREEVRRASLVAFAPTMVLNEWAADEGPHAVMPVVDLPDLNPIVAQGVLEWVDQTRPFPHEWWLMVYQVMPSLRAVVQKPSAAS